MNNSATLNAISETSDLATFSNFALLVPATFANLLAIVIFFRSVRREGHVANLFLLCLSCTDLLGCFYGLHVVATPLYQHLFSPVICSILVFFGAFFGLLSALSATVLAIDRYFALCKPYTYGIAFTRKRAFLYIGIIVLIATSVCLINVVGLGSSHQFVNNSDGSQTIQCSSRLYQTAPERRVFGYLYGILGTAVLLVVTFCNVQVIITVLKMRRRVASLEGAGAVGQTNQVEVKFARVIIGLSIVLLVCWSPFMVNSLLAQMDVKVSFQYQVASHVLVTVNFMVDPFVFLLLRKSYRKEAAHLLCGCCCHVTTTVNDVIMPPIQRSVINQSRDFQTRCTT